MQIKQLRAGSNKNTDTILGEGIVFENASLKGCGIIRIDGKFSGTIDIEGHIIIGETGFISGEVSADSALVAGTYNGNMRITNTLHMTSTASLSGKIETGKLIIDEGAQLNGTCSVTKGDKRNDVVLELPEAKEGATVEPVAVD